MIPLHLLLYRGVVVRLPISFFYKGEMVMPIGHESTRAREHRHLSLKKMEVVWRWHHHLSIKEEADGVAPSLLPAKKEMCSHQHLSLKKIEVMVVVALSPSP